MLFVLTAEPYHDNSVVLGAFADKERAVTAFIAAPGRDLGNYLSQCCFKLTSWDDDGTERRTLYIFHPEESAVFTVRGVPCRRVPAKEGGWGTWECVDPLTFDW